MEQQKDSLKVDFTQEQKNFNYTGSLGGLIGNSLTLLQLVYASLQDKKHKAIYKKAVTEYIKNGTVFVTNKDIEKAMNNLKNGGNSNE